MERKVLKAVKEVVTTTTIERPIIVIEDVDRYNPYHEDISTMEQALEVAKSDDHWTTETYSIIKSDSGKILVIEAELDEDDLQYGVEDGLFEFTKEAAEFFASPYVSQELQVKVDMGRKLRLIAIGPLTTTGWLIGRAPCGSFFRLKAKEAKAVGKAVLKEFYPEPKEPFKTTEVS